MSHTDLGEGLVILPSPTDSGPAEGVSGQPTPPETGWGEPDASEAWEQVPSHGSPGSESSSSTSSASSLPALRNDSGEAVWRLTEKALEHFESCRVQLGPEVVRIVPGRSRGKASGAVDGSGEASRA